MGQRCLAGVLVLVPLWLATAWADVVHLTTGRAISGKIELENEEQVVLRTPNGRVTLPRNLVERIERQSDGETNLSLARERVRSGDHQEAERLFLLAAQDSDPKIAKQATEELETYRQQRKRTEKHVFRPQTPLELPPEIEGEPLEAGTLQDQLDRARRALETGLYPRAERLLKPLVDDNPDAAELRYLYGRALELGKKRGARDEYQRVLGPLFLRDGRSVAWLGELARRQLAGETLERESPGVGKRWKRLVTRHFALYHPFKDPPPWLEDEPEKALNDVLERLEVQLRELKLAGRIQVILFPDRDEYLDAEEGHELSGGHAETRLAPDGYLIQIRVYPSQRFYQTTLRHEVAHAVLVDVCRDPLPAWASEGAATYVEPPRDRAFFRTWAHGRRSNGQLPGLLPFMRGEVERGSDQEEVRTFYAQASVLFDALVRLQDGPRATLKLCQLIAKAGPEQALRRFKLTEEQIEDTFARLAADAAGAGD